MPKLALLPALAMISVGFASQAAADPALPYVLLKPDLFEDVPTSPRAGSSVAHDGEWLLIGSPDGDDDGMEASGRVLVYRWQEGRWVKKPHFALGAMGDGASAQANARFGSSVAISGSRAVVGCPGCMSPNPKVYLFELTEVPSVPPVWHPLYPPLISTPDPEFGIGAVVAISEDAVAVSAPNARSSAQGVERGAVAIGRIDFDGSSVTWDEIKYGPADPAGSRFGHALAMISTSGSDAFNATRSLLVGAPAHVNSGEFGVAGRAYLFRHFSFSNTSWNLVREFANPNPGIADALGWSVAIEQPSVDVPGRIVLGAPGRNTDGRNGGGVRTYARSIGSGSDWIYNDEFTWADIESGDRFGAAVGVSGNRVLVGADRGTAGAYPDRGAAHLFERTYSTPGTAWEHIQALECFSPGDAQRCGSSLAVSPEMAMLGHPDSGEGAGGVAVFVCDQIFADSLESDGSASCMLP